MLEPFGEPHLQHSVLSCHDDTRHDVLCHSGSCCEHRVPIPEHITERSDDDAQANVWRMGHVGRMQHQLWLGRYSLKDATRLGVRQAVRTWRLSRRSMPQR